MTISQVSYIAAARHAADLARTGVRGAPVSEALAGHRPHTMVRIPDVLRLDGTEFEHAIANGLVLRGFGEVRVTGGPFDGGIDVQALSAGGDLVAVQAKRYDPVHPVTAPMVEDFVGAIETAHAGRGLFVTTSRFTEPALQVAEHAGIQAVDGSRLIELL